MGFRGGKRFDIKYLIEKLLYGIERIESLVGGFEGEGWGDFNYNTRKIVMI